MNDLSPGNLKPGDLIDVTIKGVRVARPRSATSVTILDEHDVAYQMPPQAAIERVIPAGWPPRHHDVWRDRFGDLWIVRVLLSAHDDRTYIEMHGVGDDVFAADTMLAKYGPMTLVHREDDPS